MASIAEGIRLRRAGNGFSLRQRRRHCRPGHATHQALLETMKSSVGVVVGAQYTVVLCGRWWTDRNTAKHGYVSLNARTPQQRFQNTQIPLQTVFGLPILGFVEAHTRSHQSTKTYSPLRLCTHNCQHCPIAGAWTGHVTVGSWNPRNHSHLTTYIMTSACACMLSFLWRTAWRLGLFITTHCVISKLVNIICALPPTGDANSNGEVTSACKYLHLITTGLHWENCSRPEF